jgi:uncharacterized protein (TIGR03083 family)
MESPAFMTQLRSELTTFAACLTGDLTVRIEHCGDWTLHDLAAHLGRGNLWASVAVTEKRGDYEAARAPRDPGELARWFDSTCATLLSALNQDPDVPAWTFRPPHTVGFWQRRRCLETLVHRWDAEHALGGSPHLDTDLAAEGVAEVFDTMAPRQIDRRTAVAPRHAIRLRATDTGSSWTYGPGSPVATISGSAERLLLLLWGRVTADDETIQWDGDRTTGQTVLNGPLVS